MCDFIIFSCMDLPSASRLSRILTMQIIGKLCKVNYSEKIKNIFWSDYFTRKGYPKCEILDRPDGAVGKLAPGIYAKFLGLESGQPVGQGEVGELCCKCDGMFREYYLNEEATEKAFDDGYFKTGDVGTFHCFD